MQLPTAFNGIRSIDPELLFQELQSGRKIAIVDVRDRDDVLRSGWIAGARCIPLRQLVRRRGELAGLMAERLVVVSERGVSAHGAAVALKLAGFSEVGSLSGGMTRWLELGFPVERAQAVRLPATVASIQR